MPKAAAKKAAKKGSHLLTRAPVVPRVSDTTARTVRGGAQGGVSYALVSLLAAFVTLTAEQFGALVVVGGLLVSFVQNVAENKGWIPSLLKTVPPTEESVPLVDDAGQVDTAWVIIVLLALIFLALLFNWNVST